MDERLRHLDRVYARNPLRGPLSASASNHFRIDTQHSPIPRDQPAVIPQPPQPAPSFLARFGRLALGLGLSVTVCGGCLMIWAHYGARPDLMPLGIPIAVVGQILLLFGLVLQFDSNGGEKGRPTQGDAVKQPAKVVGSSQLRFETDSDNAPLLRDLALRLDEISRRLEGESN